MYRVDYWVMGADTVNTVLSDLVGGLSPDNQRVKALKSAEYRMLRNMRNAGD